MKAPGWDSNVRGSPFLCQGTSHPHRQGRCPARREREWGAVPTPPGPGLCPRPPSSTCLDFFLNVSPPDSRVARRCPAVPEPFGGSHHPQEKAPTPPAPGGAPGGPSLPTSFALGSFGSPALFTRASCALSTPQPGRRRPSQPTVGCHGVTPSSPWLDPLPDQDELCLLGSFLGSLSCPSLTLGCVAPPPALPIALTCALSQRLAGFSASSLAWGLLEFSLLIISRLRAWRWRLLVNARRVEPHCTPGLSPSASRPTCFLGPAPHPAAH